MTQYKAGVIGCGNRGCRHAEGYQVAAQVEIVACADPVEAARTSFAEDFAVASSYEDYRAMLEREALDVVSVCTWTGQHREMVEAAAAAGVKAIHCEKPMASTWGDAKALAQALRRPRRAPHFQPPAPLWCPVCQGQTVARRRGHRCAPAAPKGRVPTCLTGARIGLTCSSFTTTKCPRNGSWARSPSNPKARCLACP